MNKVFLSGRLCRDVELKQTKAGKAVGNFTLAVDRFQGAGQEKKADFFKVSVWEKQAENCARYLKKGSKALVEGRLQTEEWEKDGVKHRAYSVVAGNVEFLTPKEKGEASPAEGPPGDDLPY